MSPSQWKFKVSVPDGLLKSAGIESSLAAAESHRSSKHHGKLCFTVDWGSNHDGKTSPRSQKAPVVGEEIPEPLARRTKKASSGRKLGLWCRFFNVKKKKKKKKHPTVTALQIRKRGSREKWNHPTATSVLQRKKKTTNDETLYKHTCFMFFCIFLNMESIQSCLVLHGRLIENVSLLFSVFVRGSEVKAPPPPCGMSLNCIVQVQALFPNMEPVFLFCFKHIWRRDQLACLLTSRRCLFYENWKGAVRRFSVNKIRETAVSHLKCTDVHNGMLVTLSWKCVALLCLQSGKFVAAYTEHVLRWRIRDTRYQHKKKKKKK